MTPEVTGQKGWIKSIFELIYPKRQERDRKPPNVLLPLCNHPIRQNTRKYEQAKCLDTTYSCVTDF